MSVKKSLDRAFEGRLRWVWWPEVAAIKEEDVRYVAVDVRSGNPAPLGPGILWLAEQFPDGNVIAMIQQLGPDIAVWMAPDGKECAA